MIINIIVPFIEHTGGIEIVFTYAKEMKKRGHNVQIYYPFIPYAMDKIGLKYVEKFAREMYKGIIRKQWKVNWFELDVPYTMVPLINNFTIRDADVVIATAWPTAYDVNRLSASKGKKYYFVQGYEIWSGEKNKVDGSYRLPMKQIVIAKWLRDLMETKFENKNAEIVYNGMNFAQFYPDPNKIYFKKNLRILLLYHIVKTKGMADGLEAFRRLKEKYQIHLVMFGVGNGTVDIPEYAEMYYNPSKEKLRELYSTSDIYLFPSWLEGWGLTVIEAMACKCAVVGNNVGCLQDIGVNRKTAMLSEPHDVNGLTNNLEELIVNQALLKEISENGYNVVQQFTWKASFDKFETMLVENKTSL